jgi:hypothetical protein
VVVIRPPGGVPLSSGPSRGAGLRGLGQGQEDFVEAGQAQRQLADADALVAESCGDLEEVGVAGDRHDDVVRGGSGRDPVGDPGQDVGGGLGAGRVGQPHAHGVPADPPLQLRGAAGREHPPVAEDRDRVGEVDA